MLPLAVGELSDLVGKGTSPRKTLKKYDVPANDNDLYKPILREDDTVLTRFLRYSGHRPAANDNRPQPPEYGIGPGHVAYIPGGGGLEGCYSLRR